MNITNVTNIINNINNMKLMKLRSIVGFVGVFSLLPLSAGEAGSAPTDLTDAVVGASFDFDDGKIPATCRVESGDWQVVNGALEGEHKTGEARLTIATGAWDHFAVEADVEFLWTADRRRWLAVSFANREGDPNRYHTLTVRRDLGARDGLEHAVRRADDSWSVRVARRGPKELDLSKSISLRVEVTSGRVRGFLGGELVLESCFAQDARPGGIALQVSSARVRFDNVRVSVLPPDFPSGFAPLHVSRTPVVIAHRGASAAAPENTLAAFALAIQNGAHACEFDVYRTADGELVCFHDRDVRRTTDFATVFPGRAETESRIENLKLSELAKLNAGTWKSAAFANEKIPTLRQALELMRGKITPVIEIKPAGIGKAVAEVVREVGMGREVFVQSFEPTAIADFSSVLPEVPTGLLLGTNGPVDSIELARECVYQARKAGASAVVPHYSLISPEFTREVHRRAMTCWVYTVNDSTIVAMLRRLGVDGIITDLPGAVLQQLGRARRVELAARKTSKSKSRRQDSAATIAPGKIELLEFARYYGDAVGLPVIVNSADRSIDTTVVVPAAIENADPEIVKAIFRQNGWELRERRLANGRRVVTLQAAATAAQQQEVVSRPIVHVEPHARTSAAARRPVVAEAPPGEVAATEFGGLTLSRVPDVLVRHLKLRRGGVLVVGVNKEQTRHPAFKALERHDVITRVGLRSVRTPRELIQALQDARAKRLELRFLRDGSTWIVEAAGNRASR